jgi:hypothetical protein
MKHSNSVGIFEYDWSSLLASLEAQTAGTIAPHTGLGYVDGELETVTKPDDLTATLDTWSKSGYKTVSKGGSTEWHMYYPDVNFDPALVSDYMSFLGVEEINACWISMIKPGYCCPWHIDQHEIRSMGKHRFHTHIKQPEMGHVFMIEDEYYLNQSVGQTFLWNDPFLWHAGFNGGKTNKWLLNFV